MFLSFSSKNFKYIVWFTHSDGIWVFNFRLLKLTHCVGKIDDGFFELVLSTKILQFSASELKSLNDETYVQSESVVI